MHADLTEYMDDDEQDQYATLLQKARERREKEFEDAEVARIRAEVARERAQSPARKLPPEPVNLDPLAFRKKAG